MAPTVDGTMSEGELWGHQREGVSYALNAFEWHGGALLAWEMGTGKTRAALSIMLHLGAERVLVVAPKAVLPVWEREAVKFLGHRAPPVLVLDHNGTKAKAEALAAFDAGIVVVNYESVWREPLARAIKSWAPGLLVCDEVHRLKSNRGKASRWIGSLASSTPARLGLTGTPLAHGPLDIWALYRTLAPHIFARTYGEFRARYTRPAMRSEEHDADVLVTAGRGGMLSRWKLRDLDHLTAAMYQIAHRVRADDVLDLPESTDQTIEVDLEPSARRVYRDLKSEYIAGLGGGEVVTAANAMVAALRLAQVTGGSLRDEDGEWHEVSTAKLDALASTLDDIGDEPVVVFGRFRADLDAIHLACKRAGLSSSELSGRRSELAEWQSGGTTVLVAQVAAGSVGIDLTRARIAIWYSLSYSLAEYLQARARILRPGQTRAVVFTHLIAKGTIDFEVYRALASRAEVVGAIVDGLRSLPLPGPSGRRS